MNAVVEVRPSVPYNFWTGETKEQRRERMNGKVYLKVKQMSLTEEAKIIRREEEKAKRQGKSDLVNGLCLHRKGIVRSVARHTLLARAYIRGIPYSSVERNTRTAPDALAIQNMVQKYSDKDVNGVVTWLAA